ncbi:MAG TPA: SEFIR domain-containing protein, partial [Thermoanaerobaculia bacterium]
MPSLFISYSHDSAAHRDRVLALANRLRADGVDCTIDQFVPMPEEGWAGWMSRQIRDARHVLVVCTEAYARRFQGDETSGAGKGVTWEGAVITRALYAVRGRNDKFIPVCFGPSSASHVPDLLSDAPLFDVTSDDEYIELLRILTDQPEVVPVPVAPVIRELPPRSISQLLDSSAVVREQRCPIPKPFPRVPRQFVDRESQRNELKTHLHGNETPFLCVVGPGGFGKSTLVQWLLNDAAPNARIRDEQLDGIAYLKCVRNQTTLQDMSELLGRTTNQAARLREIFDSPLTVEAKIEQLLVAVTDAGNVWLVLDDLQTILDHEGRPASDVLAFFDAVVSTAHSLRIVATTRVAPRLTGPGLTVIPLREGWPEEDAIAFLRNEGAPVGLDREEEPILRDAVRRVHGIPKAMETIVGFIKDGYPVTTIRKLLTDPARFAAFARYDSERGLRALIGEQVAAQPAESLMVLTALAVFAAPVPIEAIKHLLPGIDSESQLSRLFHNYLVSFDDGSLDTHPVVREVATKGQDIAPLHALAADWFLSIAAPIEKAKTLADLEPQLNAFHHRVEAGQHDQACRLVNEMQRKRLITWGYYARILDMRARLDGKLKSSELRAFDLFYRGMPLIRLGRIGDALAVLTEGMALAEEHGKTDLVSRCANTIGAAYFNLQQIGTAIEWYARSIKLRADMGNRTMVGDGNLAESYLL